MVTRSYLSSRVIAASALLSVITVVTAGVVAADDRDLLRQTSADPYVFIVFDTSGSMHWTPPCSQENFDAGLCSPLCPGGDCYALLNGDDPASKLYQAKEALSEVLEATKGVNFGFATYNQDDLRVRAKHWLYRFAAVEADGATPNVGIALDSGITYPQVGAEEVFGLGWNCDNGADDSIWARGCRADYPADLDDPWELKRVRLLPKHGTTQNVTRTVFIRDPLDGHRYAVTYHQQDDKENWQFGAAKYRSLLTIERCGSSNCDSYDLGDGVFVGQKHVYYDLDDEFVAWDIGADRGPVQEGFFSQSQASDGPAGNTCAGLDENDDTGSDRYPDSGSTYNLRWPTDSTDPRNDTDGNGSNDVDFFDVGDLVPLDWTRDHNAEILHRLAPVDGDFGVAPFFEDDPRGTCSNDGTVCGKDSDCSGAATCGNRTNRLELKSPANRPIIAFGATPLGDSLREFREWFSGCRTGACSGGWAGIAEAQDPFFTCRKKYLLVITDGDETCDGDPCAATAEMASQDDSVLTFVVAFGVEDVAGNQLSCMATAPEDKPQEERLFRPSNKQELVSALSGILQSIVVEQRAFASASIPAIQSASADDIFVSSFTPLPAKSFWVGKIDAFRKPLPLTPDNRPDIDRKCKSVIVGTDDLQSACHIWEAGDKLCEQAPDLDDALAGTLLLGDDPAAERRVVYGQRNDPLGTTPDARPNPLRLFSIPDQLATPPATNEPLEYDAQDLASGLDPEELARYEAGESSPTELRDYLLSVIGGTLGVKDVPVEFADAVDACDNRHSDGIHDGYILGDIFHANPVPILSPSDNAYFTKNISGYRDFARKNLWRRRMLTAPTNDGQLHFFDIGIRQVVENDFTADPTDKIQLYNDGKGHELFSYIPRLALPILAEQVESSNHLFSVDGSVSLGDVFIDPEDQDGDANPDEREWRTVLVGGLREGGDVFQEDLGAPYFKSGYYALDVTQPDILAARVDVTDPTLVPCPAGVACDENTIPPPEFVPSCLSFDYTGGGGQITPAGCDYPFPSELWTFTDSVVVPGREDETFYLDEDKNPSGDSVGNDIPDLADTWSRAVIGQLRICSKNGVKCDPDGEDADLEIRQVAIFGGGMDPVRKGDDEVGGNFLYIVDVETGKAIYKRELEGSAPADPTVLDVDRDGLFDRIYIGTTAGKLYKVNLEARDAFGQVPGFDPAFTVDENHVLKLDKYGMVVGGSDNFRDEFSFDQYSNSDGALDWTADPWDERGTDDGTPAGGRTTVSGGELHLEGGGGPRTLEREVDLAGVTAATLTFDWRCVGDMESGQDFVYVDLSDDGGGSWTTLLTLEGEIEMCVEPADSSAGAESLDITAFLASATRVRFRYAISVSDEDFFVDNVEITPLGTSPISEIDPPIPLDRITDAAWEPFEILDTGGSPIFVAAAAFFIPERDQYGLAIGTGDREDLWSSDNGEEVLLGGDPDGARYFVIVDENLVNDPLFYDPGVACNERLPIRQDCLRNIALADDPNLDADYLLKPDEDSLNPPFPIRPGWVLSINSGSRVTNEAFLVAGVLVFAAFEPTISSENCERGGLTRAFVVSVRNAAPIAPLGPETDDVFYSSNPPGERAIDRFHVIDEFTTAPFVDRTASKNPQGQGKTLLDSIDDDVGEAIRNALIKQFPRGSRFNKAFSIIIAALRNSTGVSVYATVPVAVYPADWKQP